MLTIGCKKIYPIKWDRNLVQQAQCKLDIGVERKRKFESALSELKVKLSKLG